MAKELEPDTIIAASAKECLSYFNILTCHIETFNVHIEDNNQDMYVRIQNLLSMKYRMQDVLNLIGRTDAALDKFLKELGRIDNPRFTNLAKAFYTNLENGAMKLYSILGTLQRIDEFKHVNVTRDKIKHLLLPSEVKFWDNNPLSDLAFDCKYKVRQTVLSFRERLQSCKIKLPLFHEEHRTIYDGSKPIKEKENETSFEGAFHEPMDYPRVKAAFEEILLNEKRVKDGKEKVQSMDWKNKGNWEEIDHYVRIINALYTVLLAGNMLKSSSPHNFTNRFESEYIHFAREGLKTLPKSVRTKKFAGNLAKKLNITNPYKQ